MRKIPFAGVELTSQRVRGLRGTSELPGRPVDYNVILYRSLVPRMSERLYSLFESFSRTCSVININTCSAQYYSQRRKANSIQIWNASSFRYLFTAHLYLSFRFLCFRLNLFFPVNFPLIFSCPADHGSYALDIIVIVRRVWTGGSVNVTLDMY